MDSLAAEAVAGALLGLILTLALIPLAIRLADRYGLHDVPGGWKPHARPTPYLGGPSVVVASSIAILALEGGVGPWQLPVAVLLLGAVGIVDDFHRLHAWPRVLAELTAAFLAWDAGLGWEVSSAPVDLALTAVWVLAVLNAFNLLDLMDGVAAGALLATALLIAAAAAIGDEQALLIAAAALAGGLAGFLPFNLSRPARIFLGDGGTMPLGYLAALGVVSALGGESAGIALPAGALLVSIPLIDMAYRIVGRLRRGVSLMTAGPDSLANRLAVRLRSPAQVAMVIAIAQIAIGSVALAAVGA